MTKTYKDLDVWQKSMRLVEIVYELSQKLPAQEQFGLTNQIRRAAVSIPSNIAEGYKRNSRKEYIQFCSIACGSAAEVETQLILISKLYPKLETGVAEEVSIEIQKMLTTMIIKLRA